jgi:hypothetical protein
MATLGGKFQSAGETKTANRPEKCSQLIRRPGPFEQARRFLRGGNNESQVVLSDPLMRDLALVLGAELSAASPSRVANLIATQVRVVENLSTGGIATFSVLHHCLTSLGISAIVREVPPTFPQPGRFT